MYEHRFHCSAKRPNDWRHDPASTGIFIHGGTCDAGPFARKGVFSLANNFSLTLPTRNGRYEDISVKNERVKLPTFFKAVEFAKNLREKTPELAGCGIFACCDMQQKNTWSGELAIQRIL